MSDTDLVNTRMLQDALDMPFWGPPVNRRRDLPKAPNIENCALCQWVHEWNPIGADEYYVAHWDGKKWNKVKWAYIPKAIRKARNKK